ncbi:hypothetical protein HDU79_007488 [Rhizoclosmatium sp. JEL0117]|nr:hypothetical protein HDU79_007488 [Rhizoclosmatium sp. JEL0117]
MTDFARHWVDAWNSHDLDKILNHYSEDIEFTSLLVVKVVNDPTGIVRGKKALRQYWAKGLALNPNLHFEIISVCHGVGGSLSIVYKSVSMNKIVTEIFWFDDSTANLVIKAMAFYSQ